MLVSLFFHLYSTVSLKFSFTTLTLPKIIYFLYPLTHMWAPWEKKLFVCLILNPLYLAYCPAQNRHSINIRWLNEWISINHVNSVAHASTLLNLSWVFSIFMFNMVIPESIIFIDYWNMFITCQIFDILKYWGSFVVYSSSTQNFYFIFICIHQTQKTKEGFSFGLLLVKSLSSAYINK